MLYTEAIKQKLRNQPRSKGDSNALHRRLLWAAADCTCRPIRLVLAVDALSPLIERLGIGLQTAKSPLSGGQMVITNIRSQCNKYNKLHSMMGFIHLMRIRYGT